MENGELVRQNECTGENSVHLSDLVLVLGDSVDRETLLVVVVLELGTDGGGNGGEKGVQLLGEILDFLQQC